MCGTHSGHKNVYMYNLGLKTSREEAKIGGCVS
jgi:hypothetical protein